MSEIKKKPTDWPQQLERGRRSMLSQISWDARTHPGYNQITRTAKSILRQDPDVMSRKKKIEIQLQGAVESGDVEMTYIFGKMLGLDDHDLSDRLIPALEMRGDDDSLSRASVLLTSNTGIKAN